MKFAVFYDSLDQMGGGERMALELAKELNADLITTIVDKEKVSRMGFSDVNIISMALPVKNIILRYPLTALRFALCNYSKKYDYFIMAGRLSVFAAPKHKPNMYICADIIREFYDLKDFYQEKISARMKPFHLAGTLFFPFIFERHLAHVQKIVSISESNKEKIKKYYHRDSEIIYPPVDSQKQFWKKNSGYWLSVSRFYPVKRIELQLEAFRRMPEKKLVISGDSAIGDHSKKYLRWLLSNKPENVEFRYADKNEDLLELYAGCEGYIATSKGEPFGMAVVEAMSAGKPVVAVNEGGHNETIIHGKTGLLVNPDIDEIVSAVEKISEKPEMYKQACIERARKFDKKMFFSRIRGLL